MQPGKCYTVIAVAAPGGITELNVQLAAATPIPGLSPVLGQDQTTGPQAVVGQAPTVTSGRSRSRVRSRSSRRPLQAKAWVQFKFTK